MSTPLSAEQLGHRQAIVDTLYIHSRGLDRADENLLKTAYWEDAEVDYGAFKGSAQQFCEIISPALTSQYELTQHNLGQSYIELQGDTAKAETYVHARHLLIGALEELNFAGRYLDNLEYRDGQWRISQRHVVMDWSFRKTVKDERQGEAFDALSKGRSDQDDPSFAFFQETIRD
jgi:hypothetical protein